MQEVGRVVQELSLYTTQIAKEYSGFYTADTVIAMNGESTVLRLKLQERRTAVNETFNTSY